MIKKVNHNSIRIFQARTKKAINQIRQLFLEYAESLNFSLCFQDFGSELNNLPGDYAPPEGRLLLATYNQKLAGCVGLRKIDSDVCEMKRLYVKQEFRNKGVGRRLANAIIEEACTIGYKYMRLDTVPSMKEAIALYRSLGFKQIKPYRHNPIEGAMFLELELSRTNN